MSPLLLAPLIALSAPAQAGDPLVVPAPQPYALLQVWATAWDFDEDPQADPAGYGDPEDDPGFKIRRARLGVEGENQKLSYELIFGTSAPADAVAAQGSSNTGGTISIVDANVGYAPWEDIWIVGGVQHVPVSRDNLFSSRDQNFQEEAVSTNWMTPGREAGLVADADFGIARVRAGAFNGNDSLVSDDNNGKLVALRGEIKTGGRKSAYMTYGSVEKPVLGVGVDAFYDADVATSTLNAGADVLFRVSGLAVMAEGRFAMIQPTATDVADPEVSADTKRLGAVAQVGYTVGDCEPALRFSMYDDDMSVKDNGDVANAEIGATWHGFADHVRLGAGYVLRLELGGRSMSNDTARIWMQMSL